MVGKVRYRLYFTYLTYAPAARRMLTTTNWVERLNRDYRRVLSMRGALPNEASLLVLLGRVGLSRKIYTYKVTGLGQEKNISNGNDQKSNKCNRNNEYYDSQEGLNKHTLWDTTVL